MSVSAIPDVTQVVHREYLEHFGEPDFSHLYDAGTAPADMPPPIERVLVMGWRPTSTLAMSTFATVGMSARALPTAAHRVELHFSVGGKPLCESTERAVTRFLANMTGYPWDHGRDLDWWHMLANPGELPAFPNCAAVLFHPRFVEDGWDVVEVGSVEVRLLNVIPMTRREHALAKESRQKLLQYWIDHETDFFRDRSTAHGLD